MHHFAYHHGFLTCEGVNLSSLADTYGTPLYIYSSQTILENYRRLHQALRPLDHKIAFAVKSNSNLSILKLFHQEGAGFDIVSGGELFRVLQAGGNASSCTFAGVGKTRSEIAYALREGIFCFNVESREELATINQVAGELQTKAPIAVRINPNVDSGTHKYISTGKSINKFGVNMEDALEIYAYASQLPHLLIRGVQTHIGSQILDPSRFKEAAEKLIPLVKELKRLYQVTFFSMGGGIGIVYKEALASGKASWWEAEGATHITPESYAEAIVPLLAPLKMRILFEPGRFLVGNAGVLVATVQYIKKGPTKTFVITDTGMNDLIRPALYEGWHEIVPVQESSSAGCAEVDIVGPVCESGDFFAQDRLLPTVQAGDQLAIMSSGAYGFSMASNYNARPLPAEVLIEDGKARLIRRRQSLEDLVVLEQSTELEKS